MSDTRVERTGLLARMKPRSGRGDATPLAMWFWDIDRVLLLIELCLMAIGLIAVAAASPASAVRYSGDHHHRSEERRVGQECVRTCRSRWRRYLSQNKDSPRTSSELIFSQKKTNLVSTTKRTDE